MGNQALSVAAGTTIAAAPSEIFDLLANLDRHRDLTDHGMRILELQGTTRPPNRWTRGTARTGRVDAARSQPRAMPE